MNLVFRRTAARLSAPHAIIQSRTGVLRIPYFPGPTGISFANDLDLAIADIKNQGCDRLIIDLRGNIGGSLGFARLASYLCPGRLPIGHSLTPNRLRQGYTREALPRVPMPRSKAGFLWALARFAVRDKSVMLLTQGLGPQPFHGRVVILVNEWTNSAAEMLAGFASENRLATVVGTKTAGNVLGAVNQELGGGYWLRVPVFGWYTSQGQCLEGAGVRPDQEIEQTVLASVRKTGRAVVVDPGWRTAGASAEIAATISEEAFDALRAPVARVALPDTPAPASAIEEKAYYPGAAEIAACARRLAKNAGVGLKAVGAT